MIRFFCLLWTCGVCVCTVCILWKFLFSLAFSCHWILLFSDWCQYCSCESKFSCVFQCTEFTDFLHFIYIIHSVRVSFIHLFAVEGLVCIAARTIDTFILSHFLLIFIFNGAIFPYMFLFRFFFSMVLFQFLSIFSYFVHFFCFFQFYSIFVRFSVIFINLYAFFIHFSTSFFIFHIFLSVCISHFFPVNAFWAILYHLALSWHSFSLFQHFFSVQTIFFLSIQHFSNHVVCTNIHIPYSEINHIFAWSKRKKLDSLFNNMTYKIQFLRVIKSKCLKLSDG